MQKYANDSQSVHWAEKIRLLECFGTCLRVGKKKVPTQKRVGKKRNPLPSQWLPAPEILNEKIPDGFNNPSSLSEESDNYPDSPLFSWVLHVKNAKRYDWDYKQHVCVIKSALFAPGRDLYIGINCLEIDSVIYPYRYIYIDCPNPSTWSDLVMRQACFFSNNCKGTYHYSTVGTGSAPGAPDFSDLWNYVFFTRANYTWYSTVNQNSYNMLNDLIGYLSVKGAYSNETSRYTGAFQAYMYKFDIHKIMDKASQFAKVASSWSLEPDTNNFTVQSGLGSEIFNNLFLNKPRNTTVAQEITEMYWQDPYLFGKIIIFKCEIPLSLTKALNLNFQSVELQSPAKVYALIVDCVGTFVQYKARSEFMLNSSTIQEIAQDLDSRREEIWVNFQTMIIGVYTLKTLDENPALREYVYGRSTPGTYAVEQTYDTSESVGLAENPVSGSEKETEIIGGKNLVILNRLLKQIFGMFGKK